MARLDGDSDTFGPIVMFGHGGIFVEALKDVTFRAAPFDETEARAMIEEIVAFPVLTGLRGQAPPTSTPSRPPSPASPSSPPPTPSRASTSIPSSSAPPAPSPSPSTPSSPPAPPPRSPGGADGRAHPEPFAARPLPRGVEPSRGSPAVRHNPNSLTTTTCSSESTAARTPQRRARWPIHPHHKRGDHRDRCRPVVPYPERTALSRLSDDDGAM